MDYLTFEELIKMAAVNKYFMSVTTLDRLHQKFINYNTSNNSIFNKASDIMLSNKIAMSKASLHSFNKSPNFNDFAKKFKQRKLEAIRTSSVINMMSDSDNISIIQESSEWTLYTNTQDPIKAIYQDIRKLKNQENCKVAPNETLDLSLTDGEINQDTTAIESNCFFTENA